MQPIAFSRALDILLGKAPRVKNQAKTKRKRRQPSEKLSMKVVDEQVKKLLKEIDSTKYSILNKFEIVLDRSLYFLKIAKDEFQIDGLIPPQIAKVLTDKFRLPTTRQAVAMALKDAGQYANRIPKGASYIYRIMQPGEDYLSKIIAKKEKAEEKK